MTSRNEQLLKQLPEHAKLDAAKARDATQALGEFLEEFLPRKSLVLAVNQVRCSHGYVGEFPLGSRKLLAEFFGIDEDRLESEKRKLLEYARGRG